MEEIDIGDDKVILKFTKEELNIIINALKVVCSEIEEWEFDTLMSDTLDHTKAFSNALEFLFKNEV